MNIMHRNIKLENILLTSNDIDRADVKLIGLGKSKKLEKGIDFTKSRVVDIGHMSPE